MNKLLKEIRKGEDDNVLSFDAIPKPDKKPPDGTDWLRSLAFGTRFLATKKGVQAVFAESFGVGAITDGGILLATEAEYGPGIVWKWAISPNFSNRYMLLQILPEPPEEEEKDERDHEQRDPD